MYFNFKYFYIKDIIKGQDVNLKMTKVVHSFAKFGG